jgi:hypothetical protein
MNDVTDTSIVFIFVFLLLLVLNSSKFFDFNIKINNTLKNGFYNVYNFLHIIFRQAGSNN